MPALEHDDIVVVADEFWDDPQRVRHKMPLAWARAGNRVLWIEKPPNPRMDWGVTGRLRDAVGGRLRQVEERLWVGSAPPAPPRLAGGGALGEALAALYCPLLAGRIKHYAARLDLRPSLFVLFQQAPIWRLLTHFPGVRSIYYCNDLFGYGRARAGAEAVEARCCAAVDLVFATSDHLRRRLAVHHPHVMHVPHAVDPGWWDANCARTPPEYARIGRPRAVYTGVVGASMDLALLGDVAERRPDVQWVLVGPVQTAHCDGAALERLGRLENVHVFGPRRVEDLPGYIAGADVLLLPYLSNANTRAAGLALKFYEYCIGGQPILATPYTDFETEARDLIAVGRDASQWAEILDGVLREHAEHPERAERRRVLARANTYADRIAIQRNALAELVE